MKILLILPPDQYQIQSFVPKEVIAAGGFYPPLGLLYLASYLRKYTNFKTEVMDARVERLSYESIRNIIKDKQPDIVGIQTLTHTFVDALMTAKMAKEAKPDCHVTLGGHHTEIYPMETIAHPNIDSLVLGEGEVSFYKLCSAVAAGKSLEGIPGVVAKENGKIVDGGPAVLIENLDELPFPAIDLVPWHKYTNIMEPGKLITTILASRGCPYRCAFCAEAGIKFRWRNVKFIVDEMQAYQAIGINDFFFFDDTFTAHRNQVITLCEEIMRRKMAISFDIRARVNNVDRDILALLKKAGCRRIQFGVETGSEEILKEINKGITLDAALKAFRLAKEAGFVTFADFMIGNPKETKEHIKLTMEFARKLDPDYIQCTVFTPLPNTELYERGMREGLFGDFWREFTRNPSPNFRPAIWNEYLTREDMDRFITTAYKAFYFRPGFLWHNFKRIRSFKGLMEKTRAAFKLMQIKGL